LSDCLAVDAVIGRQEIGSLILGRIVQQSAGAEVLAAISVEHNPSNGVLFGTGEA
jgi:hypothetical protein